MAHPVSSLLREDLNFLITNRVPRRLLTRLAGRLSRIESPALTSAVIPLWEALSGDLQLEEAEQMRFNSLHACFTRRLKPGARPIDPDSRALVSPCDAIAGASGVITNDTMFQAKGLSYSLRELLSDEVLSARLDGSRYVTLRLTASMYHRFHAPCDGEMRRIRYIFGDTWNVNPIAVRRIERLFCRNARAVIELDPGHSSVPIVLVPVAAILVASIRVHGFDDSFDMHYDGARLVDCDVPVSRGMELGYFENGSTIIMLVPREFELSDAVREGQIVRMGQSLFRRTRASSS